LDLVTALNVTIYGLGIVFLALLVVMFAIMVLSRLFAVATGKDFLAAPVAAEDDAPEVPSQSEPASEAAQAAAASSAAAARPMPARPVAPASPPSLARVAPAAATRPAPSAPAVAKPVAGGGKVTAPIPGLILSIAVKAGDTVRKGEELCVIEAMKMMNSIKAQRDCTVGEVLVAVGDSVPFGTPLFAIE